MARIARVVATGFPHHITQRGNRRQKTFFNDEDYQAYIDLTSDWCSRFGVEVWAYCLMPNHVHLIAVPESEDGLRLAIAEAHRHYTRFIHFREGWRGHLWQGRFASYVMDEKHLLACVRYIEMNPVRTGLVAKPGKWLWSSASAHMSDNDGKLVKIAPFLQITGGTWEDFLNVKIREEEIIEMQRHEKTGRPLGSTSFVEALEKTLGRLLKPKKAGEKPNDVNNRYGVPRFAWVTGMDTGVVFCRQSDFVAIGGYNERKLFAENVDFLWRLRRLGRKRGQKLTRVTSTKAITSMRKFDQHGDWHYFSLIAYALYGMCFSSKCVEKFAKKYWYDDLNRDKG